MPFIIIIIKVAKLSNLKPSLIRDTRRHRGMNALVMRELSHDVLFANTAFGTPSCTTWRCRYQRETFRNDGVVSIPETHAEPIISHEKSLIKERSNIIW